MARKETPESVRTWPVQVMIGLLALGTLISINLVWHHEVIVYGSTEAELIGCADGSAFDCDKVNTSDESELFGIPISVFAIPTYLTMIALGILALRRKEHLPLAHAFGIGLLTVLYSVFLFYVSKVRLEALCLWCISLYTINIASTALAWFATGRKIPELIQKSLGDLSPSSSSLRVAVPLCLITAIVAIGGQKAFRRSLEGEARVELPDAPKKAETTTADGGKKLKDDPAGSPTPRSLPVTLADGTTGNLEITADDLWKGNPEASVVVTKFADFQCGYCKRLGNELRRLVDAYGDRVLFVFKHFPMSPRCNPGVKNNSHPQACAAARASECARQQGRFWAFHDLTYKNQHSLGLPSLRAYAKEVDIDLDAFNACVASNETHDQVFATATHGMDVGVKSTPSLFINGDLDRGARTAEAMAFTLEQALGTDRLEAQAISNEMRQVAVANDEVPDDLPPMTEVRYGNLSFLIDTFEASIENGKAVSGKGKIPATAVSWFEAAAACQASGKRLCTEQEWIAACQGATPVDDDGDGQYADDMIEGTAYPHSDYHVRGVCWDARNRDTERPVYTGSMPGCRSLDGIYDLTGNVSEWVGDSERGAVLLGGGFDTTKDKARCYRRNQTYGPGARAYRNGFRCCQ
ncbi:MAG: vitamin K epoxide reductase family protein [Acidobacteriota bacterium]